MARQFLIPFGLLSVIPVAVVLLFMLGAGDTAPVQPKPNQAASETVSPSSEPS